MAMMGVVAFMTVGVSEATSHPVGLGTAGSFAVLAGTGVTNTGPTIVRGDLGTCPTPAVTGFPPGQVVGGTIHAADDVCRQAQADLVTAYNDAAGRAPTQIFPGAVVDFGGMTLTPGVYRADSCAITGPEPLVLDAQGDPNAVFIFQCGSTLITGPNSSVVLVNGAQACNVFWQVGSSATLGTNSTFVGTILALTTITANTGATVDGRLLARNGAVNLNDNRITVPECAPDGTTTTLPDGATTTLPDGTTTTLPDGTTTTLPDTTTTTLRPPDCDKCPPKNCPCPTDCPDPDPCDPDPCRQDPCHDGRPCGCPSHWGFDGFWWVDQWANVVNSGSASSNTGGNAATGNNSTNVVSNEQAVAEQQGTSSASNISSAVNKSDGTADITTGDAAATGNNSSTDVNQTANATRWRP